MLASKTGRSVVAVAVLLWGANAPASETRGESAESFVGRFLKSFEALDLPAFMDCFADDATMFFPVPEPSQRFEGKAAIRARFEVVFAGIRAHATATQPPFHVLQPRELRVQSVGSEVAVVTFCLVNGERVARRTLVLRREKGAWRIVHLHASNVSVGS